MERFSPAAPTGWAARRLSACYLIDIRALPQDARPQGPDQLREREVVALSQDALCERSNGVRDSVSAVPQRAMRHPDELRHGYQRRGAHGPLNVR